MPLYTSSFEKSPTTRTEGIHRISIVSPHYVGINTAHELEKHRHKYDKHIKQLAPIDSTAALLRSAGQEENFAKAYVSQFRHPSRIPVLIEFTDLALSGADVFLLCSDPSPQHCPRGFLAKIMTGLAQENGHKMTWIKERP